MTKVTGVKSKEAGYLQVEMTYDKVEGAKVYLAYGKKRAQTQACIA